ncbi:YMR1 [Candida pseudojiufengensis]|uniref:YMR1 n=1 Tax=Candida pseudojiufengensis TaxID=497109 RepID=UPI0022252AF6|nr:YMR1 [Candida pseudojiufengensis]KAI5963768.1 YMR1 [Candida pseudojiufengensis]
MENVFTVNDVVLNRRGSHILGRLILSSHHLVFIFTPNTSKPQPPKEIWICYPIIERILKARGSTWLTNNSSIVNNNSNSLEYKITSAISSSSVGPSHSPNPPLSKPPQIEGFDNYRASHIRLQCKDFTYFSFDFRNDLICTEVFNKLSALINKSKTDNGIKSLYAYSYIPNNMEKILSIKGWDIYNPVEEYTRLGLLSSNQKYWRKTTINEDYKFCPSYPSIMIVPASITNNVLKHAGKFRSKQRIPAVVYKHKSSVNGNVIARCAQPLVGLNLQNRSIQDEKLIVEIFHSQELERNTKLREGEESQDGDTEYQAQQPQRNLLVDLRPITNAMAQHALGAGTENVDNYRNKRPNKDESNDDSFSKTSRQVDKIFCNIDNIHVVRDSLTKLTTILNDLDKYDSTLSSSYTSPASLQQALTKTQWLNRLSIILQSVDRITKSIHLNNTNVIIHCSDGWDRTSQVSALAQLCLDPFYRTTKGFMILIEKEWASFGFKFKTRADHGGCIGSLIRKDTTKHHRPPPQQQIEEETIDSASESFQLENKLNNEHISIGNGAAASVTSFLQKAAKAARDIKNSAQNGLSNYPETTDDAGDFNDKPYQVSNSSSIYGGSNERSPIFHQFLDCVYQIYRQKPNKFEFNTRFLKRLFYHYYSCQYGSFLCDSERESLEFYKIYDSTISVWDYFNSRPNEFKNPNYNPNLEEDGEVVFFNCSDMRWWFELYGRSDEEMNGLSNSLDKKFAQMTFKNGKS